MFFHILRSWPLLAAFAQKIIKNEKIQKLIYYCELGCDPSHTVRTRIHPNIEEKQGKMQLYQQLHRHGMQDRSRSRKENLKPESTDGSWHQTRSNSSTALMNAEMEWG